MPTQFQLASEEVTYLETTVGSIDDDSLSHAATMIHEDEESGTVDLALAAFQRRIDQKLYNERMVGRVTDLKRRVEAVREAVLPAMRNWRAAAVASEVATAAATAATAVEAAAAAATGAAVATAAVAAVDAGETGQEPPPQKKAKVAEEAAGELSVAPPRCTEGHGAVPPLPAMPMLRTISPAAWAVSRHALERVVEALDLATATLAGESAAGGEAGDTTSAAAGGRSFNRAQGEAVLLALTAARLGPLVQMKGWAAWSRIEALSAFEVMDVDKVGSVCVCGRTRLFLALLGHLNEASMVARHDFFAS
jgi:hypothetical protein